MKTICLYYNLGRIFTIRAIAIEKTGKTHILNMYKINRLDRVIEKAGL